MKRERERDRERERGREGVGAGRGWREMHAEATAQEMATAVTSETMTERGQERELSESSEGLPLQYVLREADRPVIGSASAHHLSASIPTVDLHRLSLPDGGRDDEMAKLRSALASWGVFQATGHGIPGFLLDEVRRVGREFFDLSEEERHRSSAKGEAFAEGYGSDRVDPEAYALDWTDRILLCVEPEDQRKPELWPEKPSSFRGTLQDYAARGKRVGQLILRSMAKALDLDESHFLSQFGERMEMHCRFSHYPRCSRPDLVYGLKPHSDNSVITVILQGGDVEGLEILKDGVWVKVPNNPDVLLVMVGDLMEIMSNGMFKSLVHRVITHSDKTRISTSLFYALDQEKEIGPAEELLNEGRPRLYRDLKVRNYIDVHFRSFSEGKRSIDWAKV